MLATLASIATLTTATPRLAAVRVAIECSFGGVMNRKERQSLAHQLRRAYGANRRAANPLELHVTALADVRATECLQPYELEPMARWDVQRADRPAHQLWPAHEQVWLSPDAEEPLLALEPDVTYVVGGLVDRSVINRATAERAETAGARCVRLPLREFAPRPDVHPILSVHSVVAILASVHSGVSWEAALADELPQRYIKRREFEEERRRAHARTADSMPEY